MTRCPAKEFTDDLSYGMRLSLVRDCIFKAASENGDDYVAAWNECTRDGCLGDVPLERLRADIIQKVANMIATHADILDLGIAHAWDGWEIVKERQAVMRLVDFLRWLVEPWRG